MLAKIIALVAHEIVTEYRKIDAPPAVPAEPPAAPQADEMPRYDTSSTLSASTERAGAWDHDTKPPVRAFGFGKAD